MSYIKAFIRLCSFSLIGMSFVLGCSTPAVKTSMLVPARYREASTIKEIAVLPFDGRGGKVFSSEIEGAIAGVKVNDKQYFNIVDRASIDKAQNEMALQQYGIVDVSTAAKFGKVIGAKGIYTGVVTETNVSDSNYRESRKECASYKKENGISKCTSWREGTVRCTKRTATFAFTPKLIDVETGRVVYANNIVGSASDEVCSDSGRPLAGDEQLMAQAKDTAKNSFTRDIAPSYQTIEIKLMESADGIPSGDAYVKFKQGLEFVKAGRLDRGCELWGEAWTTEPNSTALLYNLGICSEVIGDMEQALYLYKKADKLMTKPDDRMSSALTRVQKRMDDQKKLKE